MSAAARDPGLARERTVLSWERSAFAWLVCGTFAVRLGVHRGAAALGACAGAVAVAGALVAGIAAHRGASGGGETDRGNRGAVRLTAAFAVFFSSLSVPLVVATG